MAGTKQKAGNATLDQFAYPGGELLNYLQKGKSVNIVAKNLKELELSNNIAINIANSLIENNADVLFVVPSSEMAAEIKSRLGFRAEVTTPYGLLRSALGDRKEMTSQLAAYIAYKSLNNVEEPRRTNMAKDMAVALASLNSMGIDILSIDKEKLLEKLEEATEGNKAYAKGAFYRQANPEDIEKAANAFFEFAEEYRSFKEEHNYADMADLVKEFNPEIRQKYVFALDLSDLAPLQQQAVAKLAKGSTMLMTSSAESLFGFAGADTRLRQLQKDKLTYYASTVEIPLPSILREGINVTKEKTSETARLGNATYAVEADDPIRVAAEIAKEKGKATGVFLESNSMVRDFSNILDKMGINHTAYLRIGPDKEMLDDAIAFVEGLMCDETARDKIYRAIASTLSPIPIGTALSKRNEYLGGANVQEFADFFALRSRVKTKEDIEKVLAERVSNLGPAGIEKLKTLEKLIEAVDRFPFFETSGLDDFLAWLRLTDFSEQQERRHGTQEQASEIVVSTVYNRQAQGRLFSAVFVPETWQRKQSLADLIASAAIRLSASSANISANIETKLDAILAKLDEKGELIIVAKSPDGLGIRFAGLERRSAKETTPRPNRDLLYLKEIRETQDYIRSFFADVKEGRKPLSFTLIAKADSTKDLLNQITGKVDWNEAIQTGKKVHEAIELLEKSGTYTPDKDIEKYIANAKIVKEVLKKKGYKQIAIEESEELLFENIRKQLGVPELPGWGKVGIIGVMDAIFEKGNEYLILDYKTDATRNAKEEQEHSEQLALYRRIYAAKQGIKPEQISLAIAYIGLRGIFTENEAGYSLVELSQQDISEAENRLRSKIQKIYAYSTNPEEFIKMIES